jgi:hypothetical protein
MSSDKERLAAVEAENAELKTRLAVLENKISPKPRPPTPIDEGVVRITTGPMLNTRDAPTGQQYEDLLSIVAHAHPQVVPKFEADRYGSAEKYRREYLAKFVSCFEAFFALAPSWVRTRPAPRGFLGARNQQDVGGAI